MAQVINTNGLSLIAQDNINKGQSALSSSIRRLSSDLRINSTKDDVAGQAIANRLTSNIKGPTRAARNANGGISVAQTTEDALSEINNNLQHTRELTVQASTGTNSDLDLGSIQDEIKSRLDEIGYVSGQIQFNGVNALAKDGSIKIQVGTNDGQTIAIDPEKINSDTLGLNGFNMNGFGTIANKAATISNLTTAKMDAAANIITATNNALAVSKTLDQLKDGNTVAIRADTAQTATVYTYNASAGSFSFGNTSDNTSAKAGDVATSLLPPAEQTASDVYKATNGEVSLDVDTNSKIIIGGQGTYLTSDGNLATDDAGGATAAMLDSLFKKAGNGQSIRFNKTAPVTMRGTAYSFRTGTDTGAATTNARISFIDTANRGTVLDKVATARQDTAVAANGDTSATVTYKSGAQTYQAVFATGDGTAGIKYAGDTDVSNVTATYTDTDDGMTTVGSYTTKYSVDANNDRVTVDSGTGTGKYAPKVGAEIYVSANSTLITNITSEDTVTKDPLEALDEAISSIDKFHSSLGTIQNHLGSTVTDLNNTITSLSEAQSRIQDADYTTEVFNMSKAQIIQQAGSSVLAKANQIPQQVLSLLQD